MKGQRSRAALVILLGVLAMAPTPGDIGGCGQPAEDLNQPGFISTLAYTDCKQCRECGFTTNTCVDACKVGGLPRSFPEGCAPLAHDGEVCLRRLVEASCSEYEAYVGDTPEGAAVPVLDRPRPGECLFCPVP